MLIIPAIDLKDGACVRLEQGDFNRETVYTSDVLTVAKRWVDAGAERLHLVDLDGARQGLPAQQDLVLKIAQAVPVPVEVGGGIRDEKSVASYLDQGIQWVILGSAAVANPDLLASVGRKYPGRIILGVDARAGMVATDGGVKTSALRAVDLVKQAVDWGITEVIYTDIARDGMLSGPNLTALAEIAQVGGVKVIASGGVSSLADLKRLRELEPLGVTGVIVGKALYSGNIELKTAISLLKGEESQ
ncbi:MAG: 1-(5-phosphoribosyl)-5-[(5-phosphoribosylamino)methylideneamino]imidazole-4-carboxamide isomerase [Firmicutes bacterium]|nr:1-(5-phosphoribosyl)-5-[(5-phosphoribosylamino)methylideneamino]imidazole-4-carboxamide isomerase [Bacillota bacterium]